MVSKNDPQPDATNHDDSRNTSSDMNKRDDDEQQQREHQPTEVGIGPAPGRPNGAPPRIPGQLRDLDTKGGARDSEHGERVQNKSTTSSAESNPTDPKTSVADRAASEHRPAADHASSDDI